MEFSELKIGDQVWMKNNSNLTSFRNGEKIRLIESTSEWLDASKKKEPACCLYPINENNYHESIILYNWYAVSDLRGIAPEGWRVPTLDDFRKLKANLFGSNEAFINCNSQIHESKNVNNEIFSFFCGTRDFNGSFLNFGEFGFWWTSDELKENTLYAFGFDVNSENDSLYSFYTDKGDGLSLRFIRHC